MIIVACCAFAFAPYVPADAQQRDRGGDRGRGRGDTTIIHNYRGGGERGGRSYYHDRRPGYRYDSGRGWYNPSAVIGGAVGGWLWRQFAQPEPQVIVVPEQTPVRDVAWCMNRYRSYDPQTRTYLSYSGQYVACP
jgi:hypothetical protein